MSALNDQILRAHASGDKKALATLYSRASKEAETLDSACFFATQAYIFALESNHPLAEQLHAFLVQNRRDA